MSFLSGKSIKLFMSDQVNESERIIIKGLGDVEIQIGQCSIDLRLSNQITRFKNRWWWRFKLNRKLDSNKSKNPDIYRQPESINDDKGFIVDSRELILANSKEIIELPKNKFAFITGRSSLSRLGLEIQLTQDLHQPGHFGYIPFQIKNNSPFPIRLYPNMRIAQLMIGTLDQDCEKKYDETPTAKYANEVNKNNKYKPDIEQLVHNPKIDFKFKLLSVFGDILHYILIVTGILSAITIWINFRYPDLGIPRELMILSVGCVIVSLLVRVIVHSIKKRL